ncbi:MAG: uroporphyrinogen decarboxylase family protein [Planctomycetota bacterium]
MNSKERVRTVLAGGIPDRVPLADWAIDHDTVERLIGRPTYVRNKAACTIAFWEGRHAEVQRSWIDDTIALHRILPLDMVTFTDATWRLPEPTNTPPPRQVNQDTWEDHNGKIWRFTAAADDILCIHDPAAAGRTWTVDNFPTAVGPAKPLNAASRAVLDAVIGEFGTQKYIAGPAGGEVGMVLPGGYAEGCTLLAEAPEVIEAAVAYSLACCERDDDMIHPGLDAALWGSDFGHKTGTFCSPRMFRRFYHEANRRRVARLHARGLAVLKHCCGNVRALLDDFIDIGYDAYQSIQPTAGMDIVEVKASHGTRMTLWGGVAVENLISGTADSVRADVRRSMAACKPGGRFILGASHSIAVGTKWENHRAMLEEWEKLAAYTN